MENRERLLLRERGMCDKQISITEGNTVRNNARHNVTSILGNQLRFTFCNSPWSLK